jgi:redox-regulated HSP33 family molecular chaperone
MTSQKRFKIATSCPQCGCSAVSSLSAEEMRERFGDVPNVEMECHQCMVKYAAPMKEACPEWDAECRLKQG